MIQRRSLRVKHVKVLILDEADEMLAQGFKDQVYDIYRYLPSNTQVVVVSATMTADVLRMTKQFMSAPVSFSLAGCCFLFRLNFRSIVFLFRITLQKKPKRISFIVKFTIHTFVFEPHFKIVL